LPQGNEEFECDVCCVDVAQGHGLVVDLAVLGLRLDLMDLRIFSNLSDSVILWSLILQLLK